MTTWEWNCYCNTGINLLIVGNSNTEESSNVLVVAVITTVAVFLVISLLAFIGGFVCGHYKGRKYKESSNDTSPSAAPVPLYELGCE